MLVGAYGMAEVLARHARDVTHIKIPKQVGRILPRWGDIAQNWIHILRSGVIGVIIGIIPGVGEDVAAWVSYDFAKRGSKKPEQFGKGSQEGLMAAETGNNACIGGAIIPVLSLAVPGSAPCRGAARGHVAARHPAGPAAHGRVPQLHLGSHGHVHPGRPRHR